MQRPKRSNLIFYSLLVIVLGTTLFALWKVQAQFQQSQNARLEDLQRVFSNPELLRNPSDPHINFTLLEAEVSRFENQGDYGTILVSKVFNTEEKIVYPFYLPSLKQIPDETTKKLSSTAPKITSPEILDDLSGFYQVNLISGDTQIGNLWVELDDAPLKAVKGVIGLISGLLAVSLLALGFQLRVQEKEITRTTIALDEKSREFVRLERLALAGQLAANIFHDLKKPVLNIREEAADNLEVSSSSENYTAFSHIKDQADLFLAILREGGLDRFVRANEDKEFVSLNDMLEKSLALVKYERRNVEIVRELNPDLPLIFAEPVRIIQVFSNLIINAFQAMSGQGTLILRSRKLDDIIEAEIEDNGPGIPPTHLASIFRPFYTTKPVGEGTGLGLYIVKDIIENLNGSIKVKSDIGKTIFTISFPIPLDKK